MVKPAILALEDGSVFHGISIGAAGETQGEVVFNTAMTGYQEILTDPSYAQQIVTLTYPHIGNTGINEQDRESTKVHAAGLIIRDSSLITSNWRSQMSLEEYLCQENIVAIAEIDTRKLTRLLREKGALKGCITTAVDDEAAAIAKAQQFAGLENTDLAKVVSTEKAYHWQEGSISLEQDADAATEETRNYPYHVVVYDFGVKHNILRMLADRGCQLTVVPAQTPAEEVLAMQADGVFLSNGPGDPAPCDYAITAIQTFLAENIPLFGICLGFQLLALAAEAKTMKMKFGHHGANHPVQDLATQVVMISSQNHGFAVAEDSLPASCEITHRSLFDNTIQGIAIKDKYAYGFQGHPEASPGPHDVAHVFDKFITMMEQRKVARVQSITETQTNHAEAY